MNHGEHHRQRWRREQRRRARFEQKHTALPDIRAFIYDVAAAIRGYR